MKQIIFQGGATGSPDSPEWHSWRSGGIGGSDAPVIGKDAGLNDRPAWMKGVSELWLQKTGQADFSFAGNWATQRGRNGEEPARRAFEKATGIILSPIFGEMDSCPFVRASFDGVTFDHSAIGEIKCPSPALHEAARQGSIPSYYFTQMLHQGLVLWGDPALCGWEGKQLIYISYIPETADLVWVATPCDELGVTERASRLLAAEIAFWEHVQNKTEPAGEAWEDAAHAYIDAMLQDDIAKSNLESAKNRIEVLMGDKEENEGAGIAAAYSVREGAVSYKNACETLMKWNGVEPAEFLPTFKGEPSRSLLVRVKNSTKKKKAKVEGGLSLEAARAEIARIAAKEAAADQAAFAW